MMYGKVQVWFHVFLTSALMEMSSQFQILAALAPGKGLPNTHHITCCAGPEASLESAKKKITATA
jgi:hypothetical protein